MQLAGVRARKDLIDKFFPNNNAPSVTGAVMPKEAGDDRALFDGVDRTITQETSKDLSVFTKGFAVVKYNTSTQQVQLQKTSVMPTQISSSSVLQRLILPMQKLLPV